MQFWLKELGSWQLWRQDDHGTRYLVGEFREKGHAEERLAELTRSLHKQTYWIGTPPPDRTEEQFRMS